MALASALLAFGAAVSAVQGDFSFVAIGDWGGDYDNGPVTESQNMTATAMMQTAKTLGANFSLMMGDNFYYHGINCPADVSPRFAQTFEEVYPAHFPSLEFYVIAGNHDYGEGQIANVSAQLAYSHSSKNWKFPSLWYSLRRNFTTDDGSERTLKVVLIDTVVLCGNGNANAAFIDTQLEFLGQKANPDSAGSLREEVAERQWKWLARELEEADDVDYLWVSGHYPIWSAGNDGSQQCLIDRLLPLLQMHNAQYISGHDHMLEHIVYGSTNMFVIGAGKECCYKPVNLDTVPIDAMRYMVAGSQGTMTQPPIAEPVLGGFATLRFSAEFARVTLHQHTGEVLYAAPAIPRRPGKLDVASKSFSWLWLWLARNYLWMCAVFAFSLAATAAFTTLIVRRIVRREGVEVCSNYILLSQ